MRKLVQITVIALIAAFFPAVTSTAAIVKTTITINAPSSVFAGVVNPVDVSVCPKATANASECQSGVERKVTLLANNVKVQTLTTLGGGGITTFSWTPKTSGKYTLKATVAAAGSLKALTSTTKTVVVKAKVAATSLSGYLCEQNCIAGIPDSIDLTQDLALAVGITSSVSNNRKVKLQTLKVSNTYTDDTFVFSTFQADINKFGIVVPFTDLEYLAECSGGETQNWLLRFSVDATSKSPAAVTQAKWVDIICPADNSNSSIQLNVNYSDQTLNYPDQTPPNIDVSVSAPETTQYSIYSEVCLKSDDCTNYDNWVWLDGKFAIDDIKGNHTFSFSADPGEAGIYWLRIEVFSWEDASEVYSDKYTLTLNPAP